MEDDERTHMTPAKLKALQAQNRTPTPIDAWSATTPAERLPYAAQIKEAIAEYKAEIQAFNARIPLSPLFTWEDADDDPIIQSFEQEVYEGGDDDRIRCRELSRESWRTGTVSQMEPDGSADSKDGPIDTRMFAVSKQIHEEASDAFFRENVVMVALGDDAFLGLPPLMLRDDASDIQRAYVKKLRKVAIMLPMARESEAPRLQWVLERVCRALTHSPHLEKVSVKPYMSSSWYKPQCDTLMNSVSESIKLIRKPNVVNFSEQSEF
ncbi:MAG: hypothetical protein Q9205_002601 [Flavoplaca limonia]